VVEIAVSTLLQGKVVGVPSGAAVLDAAHAARPELKQRGIPFVAMMHPVTGKTTTRHLYDLERDGAFQRPALAAFLSQAEVEANGGPAAPGEPGWFKRKWQRVFGY
jgi:hypothetical protein